MNFCLYKYFAFILFFFSMIFGLLSLFFLCSDYFFLLDWEFISLNSCSMVMTLVFDWMSCLFSGVVLFISSMVVFYSSSYMAGDLYSSRFLLLVLMFVLSMFMMIMSPNMISILIGWDGLGLVSYCLVIYFQNYKSYGAGMLTILTNRIGDVAILLSIAWMLNYGSWHFIYYTYLFENWGIYLLFLLVLAGFTKSAQIPFSSWLPAAMAAPTPVSALVHSSTLVTAGVYLLIRFSNLFLSVDCWFLVLVSVMTMFMAGLGASFEFDLSKIIALSTLSQLGLMMSILFLGFPVLAFYHLLTHAFFKALLFLCAGLIIHCMSDSQDIRHMGGIVDYLPLTCACFCISNLSLCGMPFLSGFYSKDLIVEVYSMQGINLFLYLIFFISIGLTVCYSMRLVYYCLSNGTNYYSCQCYSEDYTMNFSMVFLSFMAIVSGSLLGWLIFPIPHVVVLSFSLKMMSIFFVFLGGWLGYELSFYNYNFSLFSMNYYFTSQFLGSMWFMPKFSTYMLYSPGLFISNNFVKVMDSGWGESVFSNYSLLLFMLLSKFNIYVQYNSFKLFMSSFFFVIVCLLIM
uniref:NADH-ubiquinone oxidoreductase chain 5 n=1 Tax=Laccotrephes robustus TaxID=575834 RepID=C5HIT3_9HEMI|nr:NADH dehydrogenase subunit 5 [Laccotrephes robustus]ACJ69528.1 NADH dehydrogenase subunit 5 [Laccotrephes robustus]